MKTLIQYTSMIGILLFMLSWNAVMTQSIMISIPEEPFEMIIALITIMLLMDTFLGLMLIEINKEPY